MKRFNKFSEICRTNIYTSNDNAFRNFKLTRGRQSSFVGYPCIINNYSTKNNQELKEVEIEFEQR